MTNKELAIALSDYQNCESCNKCKGEILCRNRCIEVTLPADKYPTLVNWLGCKQGTLVCANCIFLRDPNGYCERHSLANQRKIDAEIGILMEDISDVYCADI